MSVKNYPSKGSFRKVLSKFISVNDSNDIFKSKGILFYTFSKNDLAKLGSDFYFSRNTFVEFQNKLEKEENYKKETSLQFEKKHFKEIKQSLQQLNGKIINSDINAKVETFIDHDDKLIVQINYNEYKPGNIELLDTISRSVEIEINENEDHYSMDYLVTSPNDHKVISQLINQIKTENNLDFDLTEVTLAQLNSEEKINLFQNFLAYSFDNWEISKISKVKVKRQQVNKSKQISKDQLQGINSAVLGGENLKENTFVKQITKENFYFSMMEMRFDNTITSDFLYLRIEFKSRPEKCETHIISSGFYEKEEDGSTSEIKKVMNSHQQKEILNDLNSILYQIYMDLINSYKKTEVIIPISTFPNDDNIEHSQNQSKEKILKQSTVELAATNENLKKP